MIVVTGGAGFIGSNLVRALCARGETDVLVVDDLSDGHKFRNLVGLDIADYIDKDDFLAQMSARGTLLPQTRAVFHLGACSATTQWDGRFMMRENYDYSKQLLHACDRASVPFVYASSAAVYGAGDRFVESPEFELPINVYGYSKALFDQYVRRHLAARQGPGPTLVGLRYFNVYGPGESHKGAMASVAYHLHQQVQMGENPKLFAGCDGFDDGEQRRDFVYVDDVVAVNLWCYDESAPSGIYNVGTGASEPFNAIANAVIDWHERRQALRPNCSSVQRPDRRDGALGSTSAERRIEYIPFPQSLRGHYQSHTEADLSALRNAGYRGLFRDVSEGVGDYLDRLCTDDRS